MHNICIFFGLFNIFIYLFFSLSKLPLDTIQPPTFLSSTKNLFFNFFHVLWWFCFFFSSSIFSFHSIRALSKYICIYNYITIYVCLYTFSILCFLCALSATRFAGLSLLLLCSRIISIHCQKQTKNLSPFFTFSLSLIPFSLRYVAFIFSVDIKIECHPFARYEFTSI